MREVFIDRSAIVIKEAIQPLLEPYAVLVSVCYSCITSNTELSTLPNMQAVNTYNIPHKIKELLRSVSTTNDRGKLLSNCHIDTKCVAYSCSGYVVAIGKKVTRLSVGDWVACAGAGYIHHTDLICIPEQLVVRINNEKNAKIASITTIGSLALAAIRRAKLSLADTVCIYGLDLIGQLIIQLAKLAGCKIIAIDTCQKRLGLATTNGAHYIINPTLDETEKVIDLITERYGADVTIVTTTTPDASILSQAAQWTRMQGRLLILSDTDIHIDHLSLAGKNIDVLLSTTAQSNEESSYKKIPCYEDTKWNKQRNMQTFLHLVEDGLINTQELVRTDVGLPQIQYAHNEIIQKNILGAIVSYTPLHNEQKSHLDGHKKNEPNIRFIPARNDKIRIAIIGVGTFAKEHLIPTLTNVKGTHIQAIVDTNIANALSMSRMYDAHCVYNADDDLFSRDDVDMVIVASPHHFHSTQIINALQHNKAVFVGKSILANKEQLQAIRSIVIENASIPFCVGYHRSFSPFISKIKKILEKRTTPLNIFYRINTAAIARNEWKRPDSADGGSIIDQACHIFDLFFLLTEAKPVSISVEALHASRDDIFPTDNFCVSIRFTDGSICSFLHTSLGHYDLGSERMELFFDGKSIVLDDYVRLFGFGVPAWFNETVIMPDKGYDIIMTQFLEQVRGIKNSPIIPLERWYGVSELALVVDALVCEGGGVKTL